MVNTIVLAVNSGEGKTRLFTASSTNTVKVKLLQGNKYLLKNLGDNFAPENITLSRVGNSLHVIQEGDTEASIIIEDYYNGNVKNPVLLGMAEDEQLYAYVPLTGEDYEQGYLATNGEAKEVALGGTALGSGTGIYDAADDSNNDLYGLLGWFAAASFIGAGAAIAHNSKHNDGDKSSTSPSKPSIGEAIDNTGSITGPISNGDITDETKPELSGTGYPGNTITVYDKGRIIGTTTVDENGKWSFTPEIPFGDGQHELVITETNPSGNISAPSDSLTFIVDTVPPELPAIQHIMDKVGDILGEIKPGKTTDDTRPEMSGTGEAGSIVTIFDNGVEIGKTDVDANGRWSYQPELPLSEGAHNITISQADAAGNQSGVTKGRDFYIDTTAPLTPEVGNILDTTGPVTGPLSSGDSTDETQPQMNGRGEPGNTIIIKDNDREIGSTIVDEKGNWSFKPETPFEEGQHDLVVVEKDQAGNKSEPSDPVKIIVDTIAPERPDVANAYDNTGPIKGFITTDSITDETMPEFTGKGEAGNTITIYDNGEKIGSAIVDKDGKWSFSPKEALDESSHSITVTETDLAGNVSLPSKPLDFTVDITPPLSGAEYLAITGVEDRVGSIQGNIAPGGTTDDSRPRISGIGTAGDTVQVFASDSAGNHMIGSATVQADGTWSMTPATPLLEGSNRLTIVAVDPAGNRTAPSTPSYDLNVDISVPDTPAITSVVDNVEPHTGALQKGGVTNDSTPTLNGTAEAGSTVSIIDNGQVIGSVVADANGKWTFTPASALADGNHSLHITATDAAGNVSAPSGSFGLSIDTTVPDAATGIVIMDDVGEKTGAVAPGETTDDRSPTLSGKGEPGGTVTVTDNGRPIGTAPVDENGNWTFTPDTPLDNGEHSLSTTVTDPAGNTSEPSPGISIVIDDTDVTVSVGAVKDNVGPVVGNIPQGGVTDDARPEFTGSGKPGSVVTVQDGDTVLGSTTVQPDGSWSFRPEEGLGEGEHHITVTAKDPAGNSVTSPSVDFTVDSVAPDRPVIGSALDDVGDVRGELTSGSVTDDANPTFTGTAEPGSTIRLYDNGELIGTVMTDNNGTWAFTPTTPLAEGDHALTTTATDKAGNTSEPSEAFELTTDYTPSPAGPEFLAITGVEDRVGSIQGNIAPGGTTDDSRPRISGIGTAGDTVQVFASDSAGNHMIGSATVQADGTWSMTPATPLLEGSNRLTIVAVDPAGNRTAPSTPSYDLNVDISVPDTPAITSVVDNVEPHTGALQKGGVTNDSTPTLNGTAEAGSTVSIIDNGQVIGSVVADANGKWTFTPASALADGNHSLHITATDAAGNVSAPSGSFGLSIDTTVPDAATGIVIMDDVGEKTGAVAPGETTDDRSPTLSGKGEPGGTVTVTDNGRPIGTAPVDENGNWTFTPDTPLDNGEHSLSTTVTDPAGNTSEPSPGISIVIDDTDVTVSVGAVKDNVGPVVGNIPQGGVTDDARPEFTGSGKPGSVVTVQDGDTVLGSTTVQPDGSWSFRPEEGLGEGEHHITVTAKDPAGNSVTSPSVDFTVDSVAPDRPVIGSALDDVGDVRGELTSGSVTDDANPTFTGTAEPGSTIRLYDNGELIGTVMTDNNGTWAFTPTTPLAEGDHALTTTATDVAGNTSEPSEAFKLIMDFTAPDSSKVMITGVDDQVGEHKGNVSIGGTTDDNRPTISGTGAEAGNTISVFNGSKLIGTAVVKADGTWSMKPTLPMADGLYKLTAKESDPVGHISEASPEYTITVLTVAPIPPVITSVEDNVEPHTGALQKGDVTNDSRPTLKGTALPGGTVTVFDNGEIIGTTIADNNGAWSFTPQTALKDGHHGLTASVTDTIGQISPTTGEFGIEIDTEAPAPVTGLTVIDDVGAEQGTLVSGATTDDNTPTFSGQAEAGSTVTITDNGKVIGSVVVDKDGNWTFTPGTALENGSHDFTTKVTDPAGNISAEGEHLQVTIDVIPGQVTLGNLVDKVGTITGDIPQNGVTDDTRPTLNGTAKAGSIVTIKDGDIALGTTTTKADGSWSFTPASGLGDGVHSLSAEAIDPAGNSSVSSRWEFTVDTVKPTAPTIASAADDVGSVQMTDMVSGSSTDDPTPTLSGSSEPGSIVTISDQNGVLGWVKANVDGLWSFTPTSNLSEGEHSFTATATDAAGNVSDPSNIFVLSLDFTAPDASKVTITDVVDNVGSITGSISHNGVLDDRKPVIKGTGAEAGDLITVSSTDVIGNTVILGTTKVEADGTWMLAPTGSLHDGMNKLTVTETDSAGNIAKPNASYNVNLLLTPQAPSINTIVDDSSGVSVNLNEGALTKDNTPTLKGTSAVAEGDTITIYNGSVKVGTTTAGPNGNWSFTPATKLADGSYSFTVTATDSAGQESQHSQARGILIDSTVSDAKITITAISDDLGISDSDFITSDTTLLIHGTLNKPLLADEWVEVSLDGGKTWTRSLSYSGTDWTVDLQSTSLKAGNYSIKARVVDQAGNIGSSDSHTLVINTSGPDMKGLTTTTGITTDTTHGLISGDQFSHSATATNNDMITRDDTVTLNGKLSSALLANQYLQISLDKGKSWVTLLSQSGTDWRYTLDAVNTSTTVDYQLRIIDASGNAGVNTNFAQSYRVVIDLVAPNGINLAPDLPQKLSSATYYAFNSSKYGKVEAGAIVSLVSDVNLNGTYQEGLDKVLGFAKANADGSWSLTTRLPAGAQNIAFMVWDEAGNRSSLSPSTSTGVTDGQGSTLITQSWGGTTDAEESGLNAAAVTISGSGTWSFAQSVRGTSGTTTANALRVYTGQNRDDYTSMYLEQPSTSNGAGWNINNANYGRFINSMLFADINRDGLTDVMSQVSAYDNSGYTAYWMQNADGSYAPKALYQGTLNHLGGAIAYDREGDGYLDFVLADSASDSISFIKNQNGNLTYEQANGFPPGHPGGAIPVSLSLIHEVGAVDIDNNGTVDITAHIDYNGAGSYAGDSSRGLGVMYNTVNGNGTMSFSSVAYAANVFRNDGTTDYGNLSISMTYADFNGDGWLDLFLSRGSKNAQNSDESRIYLNDGTGKLMATDQQALWFGDTMDGGTSLAVDWNHDGKMDIIEVPRQYSRYSEAQSNSPVLYTNTGNNSWNSNATALTTQKFTDITGAVALDYDWDGSMDLVMYRAGSDAAVVAGPASAPTLLVKNTNIAADGTSLQIRIVDANGINTFFSNTVKLYDSHGKLVSTQLINPQASGSSNSMGLVSFFGLSPDETYSVQLLRITNGVANHVGAFAGVQGGNINSTVNENWGGLTTGKAHDAYVLTAESTGASNHTIGTNGIVGTGYNDTFFSSAGNDIYTGGGGWNQVVNGKNVWSETGGMDIVDYGRAPVAVTANLWTSVATGHGTDKLIGIEGLAGSRLGDTFTDNSANNLFEGRGGNDTFYLVNGGNDTLMYKVLSGMEKDATGGNGNDKVHGFKVGNVVTNVDADLLDLSDLLDYTGPISFFQDEGKLVLDRASQGIHDYLKVETVGNDTVISIDRDGQGGQYSSSSIITLADVHTDLLTLLQNNQIIV
ncbi:Ig-like domain-containing protein [Enterobacter bugandensis]|uniref:Ig-like domain-containing protein n=1 Tax=Enterobacter bugandensis TaxID=881260 RepID=UPI0023AEAA68|nr:Ig-like domain-containing protein [Enterobacter bugandensis]MDE7590816.1 Ig-like domain-containing protein [Enterobacter bugandensis]